MYHLSEPVKDLTLGEHLAFLFDGADATVKVAAFTEHHDDE